MRVASQLLEAGNLCMQAGPYFPVLCIEYPVKYARGEDVTLCTAKCEAVASWVFGPRTAASKAAFKANLDRLGHPASHDDSNQILTFDSHPELLKAQGLQQSPTIDDFFCIEVWMVERGLKVGLLVLSKGMSGDSAARCIQAQCSDFKSVILDDERSQMSTKNALFRGKSSSRCHVWLVLWNRLSLGHELVYEKHLG